MCGITGVFHPNREFAVDAQLLGRMNDTQLHRGPDGHGVYAEHGIGLSHRRLSIIDLEGGVQPFFSEDREISLTFNGEIYNFLDVRQTLEKLGHRFRTRSDTEVILQAWREWGTDCLRHLNGMFAFAIWDNRTQQMFIARDRLGVKPLYYTTLSDHSTWFASELKALLAHPLIDQSMDPTAIEDYFTFGYVPDPRSIFKSVAKLPPGHYLLLSRGRAPQVVQYWDLDLSEPRDYGLNPAETAEAVADQLQAAVNRRLISDVPLGAFLSGGIDSSAVVAMMRETGLDQLLTCSIGFDEKRYDESTYARMVAEQKQTDHKMRTVQTADFDLADQLISIYDEPFADSSAIPTYRVCELAREHVTVALSGDAGDECFLGYRRYKLFAAEQTFRDALPLKMRQAVFGPLGEYFPKLDWAPRVFRGKTTFQALARTTADAYLHGVSICDENLRRSMFSDSLKNDLQGYRSNQVFDDLQADKTFDDPMRLIQYLDYKTYLPGDILTKVDRASMAHSLEVRAPFLDYEFVQWSAGLSTGLKLHKGVTKHILKKAMEPYLPHDVLYRKKMGFAVPLDIWFRGPLKERIQQTLASGPLVDSGLFNPAVLTRMAQDHATGRRDYAAPLWSLFMFDGFLRSVA